MLDAWAGLFRTSARRGLFSPCPSRRGIRASGRGCQSSPARNSDWANYYDDTVYSPKALQYKNKLVSDFLDLVKPRDVWDFASNTGYFSRISSNKGIKTISFDMEPSCVELNYRESKNNREENILPLVLDLTNPTSSYGWGCNERMSILERGPADTALALAIIHHLTISNNIPFLNIAEFMSKVCNSLIIEFIPKYDPQVKIMLSNRDDSIIRYSQDTFEREFGKYFKLEHTMKIIESERTLYLMVKKEL